MKEAAKFKLLPAKPGTCAFCATAHGPAEAHNLRSLFYEVRFRQKWGRPPTWADACAHLDKAVAAAWRAALAELGEEWTEPAGEPIREPYAVSDPFRAGP